jgi:hypothetical protein
LPEFQVAMQPALNRLGRIAIVRAIRLAVKEEHNGQNLGGFDLDRALSRWEVNMLILWPDNHRDQRPVEGTLTNAKNHSVSTTIICVDDADINATA